MDEQNPMDIETDADVVELGVEEETGDPEIEENPNQGPSQSYIDDEDGATCSVCLEAWTNCGAHRICSLKCGHLFGHKCILRWLDSQSKKNCPTCKQSVKRSDLRFIYAKKLVAIDNLELESMKQQLENALAQKNASLQSISKYISREQILTAEIQQLKSKLNSLLGKKSTDLRLTSQTPLSRIRLYMEKNVDICNKGGCRECRVFDISVPQDLIFIASRSPTDLFSGFGLKKMSLSMYRPMKFIPLHKETIRDMCLHPTENTVLTVATDKKFRITDTQTTNTFCTVSLESAPWACSWSPKCPDNIIIGTQNGTVLVFDRRNTVTPKTSVSIPGDFSPVVSLTGVTDDSGSDTLLVAKLNSAWAFEFHPDGNYSRHLLPLEGPFLSLKHDDATKQILVSSRPNSQLPFARHTVCYLEKTSDPYAISCNTVHTFKGGSTAKLLAKTSCFIPGNIVAGHHETRKSILLYSVNTGEEVGLCPTHDNPVLDIKGFQTNDGKFLTYLNEKKLEFFKFNHA